MTGVAGLLENFAHYYEKIMERAQYQPLLAQQRNRFYEQYRMAEAFYLSAAREKSLSAGERAELDARFYALTERITYLQSLSGDTDLRAVSM